MRFDKYLPTDRLRPYIKHFVVSENSLEDQYKIFPSSGLVAGFQYKGQLSTVTNEKVHTLSTAGITGITDSYKVFRNSPDIGTVLVFFTETGFAQFSSHPTHDLFNQSIALDNIFNRNDVAETEERLASARSDKQRVNLVEKFMLSQLKDIQTDKLIVEAVKLIYQSRGTIRIRELNDHLAISQSPFEKRFRKVVGTTPKKFASIVRFNTVLEGVKSTKSLTEICYENGFFDQAHFTKEFRQFTGDSPENFKRRS